MSLWIDEEHEICSLQQCYVHPRIVCETEMDSSWVFGWKFISDLDHKEKQRRLL